MRVKKTVRSCKLCKPAYTTYRKKKKLHDLTVFLLHAFTAKKKLHDLQQKNFLHDLQQKKITRRDGFFVARIYSVKTNYTTYRKKKITRCDNFFLHVYTTKIQKLHDLTTKEELPILPKLPACRQCAHLWATSDSAPRSIAVGTPQAAWVMYPPCPIFPTRQILGVSVRPHHPPPGNTAEHSFWLSCG